MSTNTERTVLLVEDSPADVELVREVVDEIEPRFSINVADDGRQGLSACRREPDRQQTAPDLVLLDIDLPHMNGFEVLKELKNDEDLRRIPVVILTMSNAPRDLNRAYDLGASCVVTKPLGFEEFRGLLESFDRFWFHHVAFPVIEEDLSE